MDGILPITMSQMTLRNKVIALSCVLALFVSIPLSLVYFRQINALAEEKNLLSFSNRTDLAVAGFEDTFATLERDLSVL